jgi:glycosyltransferase involved in cell wall biosynthesis
MTYFPNSVELNKFQNEKLKININKHHCFITVARFSEKKKGYDLLPEIAEGLIKKKIKFKWTIIGTKTSQLMKNEIIKNNKEFFEIIENIDNFDEKFFPNSKLIKKYLEADLYINLSRIESFGITFIEALASKIPIVTFNTKGVNEIVTDNYNGFVIPEISNSLMVNKIHELCSDFSKVLSIKENTLKSVQIYDLNIISEKILRTYESISLNNID